jgi:hypothetical protein
VRIRFVCNAIAIGAASAIVAVAAPLASAVSTTPIVGATLTHSTIRSCDLHGSEGIVAQYNDPGRRRRVRTQLAAMYAAGLRSIRILLWHMADASNQDWGVVSSAGGKLAEPYRSNLVRFVSDVKAAGFPLFTVDYAPMWTNSPIGVYGSDLWDPSKFEENWKFLVDTRNLVKQYGPPTTHFDLLSEGPPSVYQPPWVIERLNSYIKTFWTRYADEFGTSDATFSVLVSAGQLLDRLPQFIETIRSTGRPFPSWIEIKPDWTSSLYEELRQTDAVLTQHGLTTPLVLGEASYDDSGAAAQIARFMRESSRPIAEVYEWWQRLDVPDTPCISPPYRGDAYLAAVTGQAVPPPTPSPPPDLPVPVIRGAVAANGSVSLRDSSGSITALDAGEYTLIVTDKSKRFGFYLIDTTAGDLATSKRFVGVKTWHVELGIQSPYGSHDVYRSERSSSRREIVLR